MKKDTIAKILMCPSCRGSSWGLFKNELICNECKNKVEIRGGSIRMIPDGTHSGLTRDPLDDIKYFFKKFDKLYNLLMRLIGPVYSDGSLKRFIKQNCSQKSRVIAVNFGSGSSRLNDEIINVDMFNFNNVDLVCDISKIPFRNDSIDVAINIAVLEHVSNPEAIIEEMYRVLKPGGLIYTVYPFIVGFHASPHDYTRVTHEGIKQLHNKFTTIGVHNVGGPTSGMLWTLQEWIALILSLGIKKIHPFVYLLVMVCTFPVKFLDVILNRLEMSRNISSCFAFIGKKE